MIKKGKRLFLLPSFLELVNKFESLLPIVYSASRAIGKEKKRKEKAKSKSIELIISPFVD